MYKEQTYEYCKTGNKTYTENKNISIQKKKQTKHTKTNTCSKTHENEFKTYKNMEASRHPNLLNKLQRPTTHIQDTRRTKQHTKSYKNTAHRKGTTQNRNT